MVKRITLGIFSALGLAVLILDSRTALAGASAGLELCIRSVLPSLFPFFILSGLLSDALSGVSLPLLRPLGKLCGIPRGAEALVLTGFLAGYPAGAQGVTQCALRGQLLKKDARRMLGFCSNAGPAFLFGILGTQFPSPLYCWALWAIHILSAILTGALLPGKSRDGAEITPVSPRPVAQILTASVKTAAQVCGWVVLFRVVLAFLARWCLWLLPQGAAVVVTGILELANGCCSLHLIKNMGLRFLVCSGILAFGGICVLLQTLSVTHSLGLGLYLPGKLLQTALSLLLTACVQFCLIPGGKSPYAPAVIGISLGSILLIYAILRKMQKISSNPVPSGV